MNCSGSALRKIQQKHKTKQRSWKKYERHTGRYEKMKQQHTAIEAERQRRKEQYDRIAAFAKMLTEQAELPIDFSDNLWLAAVNHATVNANETVTFTFKDGTEITEQM